MSSREFILTSKFVQWAGVVDTMRSSLIFLASGLTNYPIGVGINLEGHVVVADNHNNFNLTVFDQDGRLLSALESRVKHAQCFDVALLDSDSAVLASKDYRLYVYRYGSISSSNLFTPQSTVHF